MRPRGPGGKMEAVRGGHCGPELVVVDDQLVLDDQLRPSRQELCSPERESPASSSRTNSLRVLLWQQLRSRSSNVVAVLRKVFRSGGGGGGRASSDSPRISKPPEEGWPPMPPAGSPGELRHLFSLHVDAPPSCKVSPAEAVPQRSVARKGDPSLGAHQTSSPPPSGFLEKGEPKQSGRTPCEPNAKHIKLVRTRRIMKEFQELSKAQQASKDPVFTVELVNDCLYEWKVKLRKVDPDCALHRDMLKFGIAHILLGLSFPENFPFQPPFMRVLAPRLEKGFVMAGGAICMELLTPRGWASAYTIEAVIMQFAASLAKGQGRVCRRQMHQKEFSKRSAQSSFRSLVKTHDKYGWVTPPLTEG